MNSTIQPEGSTEKFETERPASGGVETSRSTSSTMEVNGCSYEFNSTRYNRLRVFNTAGLLSGHRPNEHIPIEPHPGDQSHMDFNQICDSLHPLPNRMLTNREEWVCYAIRNYSPLSYEEYEGLMAEKVRKLKEDREKPPRPKRSAKVDRTPSDTPSQNEIESAIDSAAHEKVVERIREVKEEEEAMYRRIANTIAKKSKKASKAAVRDAKATFSSFVREIPSAELFVSSESDDKYKRIIVDVLSVFAQLATAETLTQFSVAILGFAARNVPPETYSAVHRFFSAQFSKALGSRVEIQEVNGEPVAGSMEDQGPITDFLKKIRDFCSLTRGSMKEYKEVPLFKAFKSWMGVIACLGFIEDKKTLTVRNLDIITMNWVEADQNADLVNLPELVLKALEFSIDVALIWEETGDGRNILIPRNVFTEHAKIMSKRPYALAGQTGEEELGCTINQFVLRLKVHANNVQHQILHTHGAERHAFQRALAACSELAAELSVKLFSNDLVEQAYLVIINSEPGAGKSYATRKIAALMITTKDGGQVTSNDSRISQTTRSKYDDDITNDTRVIVLDDAGNSKPGCLSEFDVLPHVWIIDKINNTARPAHKASIEEKNKVHPVYYGAIINTNVWHLHLPHSAEDPRASGRRVQTAFDLLVPAEFRTEFGSFDAKKYNRKCVEANESGLPLPDPNLYQLWRYGVTPNGKLIKIKIDEPLRPTAFWKYLCGDIDRFRKEQEAYVETMSQPLYRCKHNCVNVDCPECRADMLEQEESACETSKEVEPESQALMPTWDLLKLVAIDQKLSWFPTWSPVGFVARRLFSMTFRLKWSFFARLFLVLFLGLIGPLLLMSLVAFHFFPTYSSPWNLGVWSATYLWGACIYSVCFLWSVLSYVRRRVMNAISDTMLDLHEGAGEYYDRIGTLRFGLAVAAITTAASIYRLWSSASNLFRPSLQDQTLSPTTKEEVEKRRAEVNQWDRIQLPVEPLPKGAKLEGMTLEDVKNVIPANYYEMTLQSNSKFKAKIFMTSSGVGIIPTHHLSALKCYGVDKEKFDFVRFINGTQFSAYIKEHEPIAPDLTRVYLTTSHTVRDLTDLIMTGEYRGFANLITPEHKSITTRTFMWEYTDRARGEYISYPGSTHEYNQITTKGDCMSAAIRCDQPYGIVGFHLSGVKGRPEGTCGSVDMTKFKGAQENQTYTPETRTLQPARVEEVPTTVFDRQIFEPVPPHPTAVSQFAGLASTLRTDTPEMRQVVKDPAKMIGEEYPQAQCYGGRMIKARRSQSCVKRTPLSPWLEEGGRKCLWGPPPNQPGTAYARGFSTISHPMLQFPVSFLDWARRDYVAPLLNPDLQDMYGEVRPLTDTEVLNGCRSRKFIKAMNVDTAPGIGLNGKKSKHLVETVEVDGRKTYSPQTYLQEAYEADMQKLEKGIQTHPIAKTSLKDEPTVGKNRIFNVLPMVFLMCGRKLLQMIVDFFLTFPFISEMAVGIQCLNDEWTQLHHHLAAFDEPDSHIWQHQVLEGDYSSYDQRITTQLLENVGLIFAVMATHFGFESRYTRAIATWFQDIMRPLVSFNGVLLSFLGFNLSGNNVTIIINNLVNSMLLRLFYVDYYVHELGCGLGDIPPFRSNVRAVFVGDDSLASTRLSWYNMRNYQRFLERYGMPYTDANKSPVVPDFFHLSQVSLCKRQFHMIDENTALAPIELNSLYKSMHCWMDRGKVDVMSILPQNVDAALVELARHPRATFEIEAPVIYNAVYKAGFAHMCRYHGATFDEMRTIVMSYYADPTSPSLADLEDDDSLDTFETEA